MSMILLAVTSLLGRVSTKVNAMYRTVSFTPHVFRQKIYPIDRAPQVFVSLDAYRRMGLFVDLAPQEISWLGTVLELSSGDFLIDEVFLFPQEVTEVSTEMTGKGIAEVTIQLLSRPDGIDVVNNLRFWGHSHVYMPTDPSQQDEDEMQTLRNPDCPWFIRGIFNKDGRAEFTVFLYDRGIKIVDAAWTIVDTLSDDLRREIELEIKEKCLTAKKPHDTVFVRKRGRRHGR